jgi:2-phosphosulfolactate phosphatase
LFIIVHFVIDFSFDTALMVIFGPIFPGMKIQILHLVEGAKKAEGIAVIIDVFRAFSTACYIMNNGAEKIIPVSETAHAFRMKEKNPEYILLGEEFEKQIPGFDFGNSPLHILNTDFTGRTVVHRTSSGTLGMVEALRADELLTGSFVNAGAIVNYILKHNPGKVSLVCMGYAALRPIEEDTLCAEYIREALKRRKSDFPGMVRKIKETSAQRFFDPANASFSPPEDVDLCLDLNRFNFVLRAKRPSQDYIYLERINVMPFSYNG